ncbi:MAG: MerR family transcriptional regulator, partial [Candidatus Omnitrophica bacterium]|nr:MerR family transcriptional regulator [Candidatus Omnitrophota bacterium]
EKAMKPKIRISESDAVYAIGIVSQLLDMPEWTLRALEKEGLVAPQRKFKKIRFYSMKDIKRLEYIHYLMDEKGVNISGIKVILEMEE